MNPHSESAERIWRAARTIQADGLPLERFSVRVHPAQRAEMVTAGERFFGLVSIRPGEERVLGLPLVADPSLDEGRIVLFYEVEA